QPTERGQCSYATSTTIALGTANSQARCVTYNIWEQVNPDGTKLPLMEPFPPELPECADYAPSTGLPAGGQSN
ncbi:hypothetical protein Ptr86124_013970, partial [Pyrenophora tritici-repentis]